MLLASVMGVLAWHYVSAAYATAQAVDIERGLAVSEAEVIYDRNGEEIGRAFEQNRTSVELSEVSGLFQTTLLAVEDRKFYAHGGADYKGIIRAMLVNLRARRFVQGGSTLTQQLAKHVLDDNSKSIERKLVELFVAFRLEKLYSKNQILTFYLNRVAFGNGFYGVDAAARGYFNTSAANLTTSQVAMLVAIIRSPTRFSPYKNPEKLRPVVNAVIDKMLEAHLISAAQKEETKRAPLVILPRFRQTIGVKTYPAARAVLIAEKVLSPADKKVRVYTTINSSIQQKLEKIAAGMPSKDRQVAIGVVDIASGELLGYIGGSNFLEAPYDRFFSMERSAGQILALPDIAKLFDSGATPASLVPVSQGSMAQITLQDAIALNMRTALPAASRIVSPEQALNALLPLCAGSNPVTFVRSVITSDKTVLFPGSKKLSSSYSPGAASDVLDMLDSATFVGSSIGGLDGWAVRFGKSQAVLLWVGTDAAVSLGSKQTIENEARELISRVADSIALSARELRVRAPQYVNRSTGLLSDNVAGAIPVYTSATLAQVPPGNPWQNISLFDVKGVSAGELSPWAGAPSVNFLLPSPRPGIETSDGVTVVSSPLITMPYLFFPRPEAFESTDAMVSAISEMTEVADPLSVFATRRSFPTLARCSTPFTRDMPTYTRNYAFKLEYSMVTGLAGVELSPSSATPVDGETLYPLYSGRYGLEKMIDGWGLCSPGHLTIKPDYFGYPQEAILSPGAVSPPLKLAIAHDAQMAAVAAMGDVTDGAFVIMNATDGAILAMVSKPLGEELNKAVSFAAPPASSFKPVTALASFVALDRVTEYNLGSLDVSGVKFNFPREIGTAGLVPALSHSLNSYFIQLGLDTGKQPLLDVAAALGLGSPSGFLLGGSSGILPDDNFVRLIHSRLFGSGDVANTSIGQGDLSVTPIQMAKVYATIATRGTIPRPRLLLSEPVDVRRFQFDIDPKYWAILDAGLEGVVQDGTGSAAQSSAFSSLRAKTGTAQLGTGATKRNSAWFCGYFLMSGNMYSFAILVNGVPGETLSGGSAAAPVLGRFLGSMASKAEAQNYSYPKVELPEPADVISDPVASLVTRIPPQTSVEDIANKAMRDQFEQ